jgi:DNA polymerase III subunit gamma/tau
LSSAAAAAGSAGTRPNVSVEDKAVLAKHEAKIIMQVPVPVEEVAAMAGSGSTTLTEPVKPYIKPTEVVERKKFSQPSGKLSTGSLGIKSILDPPKNKLAENADALLPDLAEPFTHEQFKAAWNDYALNFKREMKDSLYTTLTDSSPTVSSDYKIRLELTTFQATQLEREKAGLLQHLRSKLKNYQLSLNISVIETAQSPIKDNKATFETLAAENPSLHKLRKLFNLDIDY